MTAPAPQSVPSRHVQEKRQRRRGEILRAALAAFRERGYHQTTLEDIASRLGIRSSALYHYFPDKEAILYACHRESLNELDRLMAEAEARYDDPLQRLAYLVREHVRVMTETLQGSPLTFEVAPLAPELQREIIAGRDRYERTLRDLIAGTQRGRRGQKVDAKLATFAILGAINWIARWYRPGGDTTPSALGDAFADYLAGGLTCR